MQTYAKCPKCGRRVERSGAVLAGDALCPVYQCDECLVAVEMFGSEEEIALTFAVDAEGRAFDPAAQDGEPAGWEREAGDSAST